jgi:sulfatase-modifying factor enzyme 1
MLDLSRLGVAGPTSATPSCPSDSALVGTVCVDKYEASAWQIDPRDADLVGKVQAGTVTLADLTAAGASQLGCGASQGQAPYPATFPESGQWTPIPGSSPASPGVYAVSVAGVLPSACVSWFQAAQACRLSRKRLLTNLEWQDAAAGTPDPGAADDGVTTCNTKAASGSVDTGSRAQCVSSWGAFDMVGNLWEWVADWADQAASCTDWTSQTSLPGGDMVCFGGAGDPGADPLKGIPGALIRGGDGGTLGQLPGGQSAGVFAVDSHTLPPAGGISTGFRCGR